MVKPSLDDVSRENQQPFSLFTSRFGRYPQIDLDSNENEEDSDGEDDHMEYQDPAAPVIFEEGLTAADK